MSKRGKYFFIFTVHTLQAYNLSQLGIALSKQIYKIQNIYKLYYGILQMGFTEYSILENV